MNVRRWSVPNPFGRTASLEAVNSRIAPMTEEKIDEAELERYGIRRVPADVFVWGGYRYSSARDALAAAKRNAKP